MVQRKVSRETFLKRRRAKERKARRELSRLQNEMKHSISELPNCWRDILGNKELVVLLHKVELPIVKEEKHSATHDESLDYAIMDDDKSLMERLNSSIQVGNIKSEEHFKMHESVDEEEEIPLTERLSRIELLDKKSDEHLDCIEKSEPAEVKIELDVSDLGSTLKNVLKRKLRVTLKDIGPELKKKNYVLNLVRNQENCGVSSGRARIKRKSNNLTRYPSLSDSSCSSVTDKFHSPVLETSIRDVSVKRTIDTNNTSCSKLKGNIEEKPVGKSVQNVVGKKKRGRKPKSMRQLPDDANRSVYDHNLNVVAQSSKQESMQQGDVKISPKKDDAPDLVLNTSKDTVRNINTSNTSNVSSIFNFNDDWKPEFNNIQSFGKEKLVTGFNSDNEKINDPPLKLYKKDEQKDKEFEVDKIATTSEVTMIETPKPKSIRGSKSSEKIRVRNSILLTGSPYAIKIINADKNAGQTWIRKNHTPNQNDKMGVISFGNASSAIETWNANDVNSKKTTEPSPKPNIAKPARENETNERNDQQKSPNKSLVQSPADLRATPLQQNTIASPITVSLQNSDTEICNSSQSSLKSELGDVESLSDGSKVGVGDNKTLVNRKRKFKNPLNLDRCHRSAPKKIKLNRSSWQGNKDDLSVRTCSSSNSVSPGPAHLLTPLHDMSSSTEVSKKRLNFYSERHTGEEFGRPALTKSSQGPEPLKNPEVRMVTPSSTDSRLEEQHTPIVERQTSSDTMSSKQKSTHEGDIKKSSKIGKPNPNAKRLTISDVETTVNKCADSKFKLNAVANTRTKCSVKSRLGPRVVCESSSSVKSCLSSLRNTYPTKSITKAITSSTESSPANVGRSDPSSPSTYMSSEKLRGFKELQKYKIPKISRDSINESPHSNSQHSQMSEACNSNPINENIDDEDYICLHPEESFSDLEEDFNDLASKKTSSQNAESFSMTDSVFDRFMTKNQSEFDVQYENSKDVSSQNGIFEKGKTHESLRMKPVLTINVAKPTELIDSKFSSPSDHASALDDKPNKFAHRYFLGTCFRFLRYGNCRLDDDCRYGHDVKNLIPKILSANWATFMKLVTYMVEQNYLNLLQMVVAKKVWHIETNEIISLLQTVYNLKPHCFHQQDLVLAAVNALRAHRVPLKEIICKFLTFVSEDVCLRNLFGAIRKYVPNGAVWDTTKDLVLSITNLSTCIVRDIMLECVESRPENAGDVNACVVARLAPLFRATLSNDLRARFQSLLEEPAQIEESTKKCNNASLPMSSQSNEVPIICHGITSQDQIKLHDCLQDYNNVTSASPVRTDNSSVSSNSNISYTKDDNNNLNVDSSKSFVVEQIENLPVSRSVFRDRFSKFYGLLNTLRQALIQENHQFAIQILDYARSFQKDNTFYTLSCYRKLCQEVKLSTHHMNKIRMLTVQMNVDLALRKSLAEITKYILIRLVDEGLYMLAYSLIENWKELMDCDASVSLLMAEIYLGSDQPLEALNVLKRHNIIHSNRCKWTVPCDAKDEYYRGKLLPLLLNALSITNPDHALYLFEFLAHIQSSNFHPIDLTRCVNGLVSSILLTGNMELIERAGRLVFAYSIPLAAITHRALVATAISEDVLLARQLYRVAMDRGIYSSAKFYPTTHIVIDPHCSFEEVYLALSEFTKDLLVNIGPALSRLKNHQIPVYIFLESISWHEQASGEETDQPDAFKRFHAFKLVVRDVLETRFEPPLKLVPRVGDKILKIQPKSLLNYLRAGHL